MRVSLLLIITISLVGSSFAQNCELKTRLVGYSHIAYQLDTIDAKTYDKVVSQLTETTKKEITPLSEAHFLKKYPSIFKKQGLCYSFNTIEDNPLKACGLDTTMDMRERSRYSFKGQYCNSALIFVEGYESWGYLTVNLTSGMAFYTMGEPKTYNCDLVVAHSNYYGEEEIAITNMESKKQSIIVIQDHWSTVGTKQKGNTFYFKLKSMSYNCMGNIKYIKVNLKK